MTKLIAMLMSIFYTMVSSKEYFRVCYYTNWAQYRPQPMTFFPEDIDASLCTHIMFAFAKIGDDQTLQPYEWNDYTMYHRVLALKQKYPALKVSLAVGGWNHEATPVSKFSVMVNNDFYRKTFIASVVSVLRKYGFDGLDLDWEYPAGRNNSPPGDKQKYTQLCKELQQAFQVDAGNGGQSPLMLSAAVAAGIDKIKPGYEISKIAKYIDLLNLMTYDFHGNWDPVTGHHTAMDYDGGSGEYRKEYTVKFALNYWLSKGFPAEKITLGFATYGRPFRLQSAADNGLHAPKSKWTQPRTGKYTRTTGFLAYYEICNYGYTTVSNNSAGSPYGYKDTDWVGFDTKESLDGKVTTLLKVKGLAGAMFWSLPLDDFNGSQCGQGNYPLIKAVKEALENDSPTLSVLHKRRSLKSRERWHRNKKMTRKSRRMRHRRV